VKATTPEHGKILRMIGATEVIFPERQMGHRVAGRLNSPNVYDQIPLAEDLSVLEMVTPSMLTGKSLQDLRLRDQHRVNLIAIRKPDGKAGMKTVIPRANFQIQSGQVLVVVGMNDDIEAFKRLR
jgi:trk system potassium uptake protein TrkA